MQPTILGQDYQTLKGSLARRWDHLYHVIQDGVWFHFHRIMDGTTVQSTPRYTHGVGMGIFSDGFVQVSEDEYKSIQDDVSEELAYMGYFCNQLFPEYAQGDGLILPLSDGSPFVWENVWSQDIFQEEMDLHMRQHSTNWAISRFGEKRKDLFHELKFDQMTEEGRFYHLGLDIWADAGTEVASLVDGVVVDSWSESGSGNYGGYVCLKSESNMWNPVYIFIGHLDPNSVPEVGMSIQKSEIIGVLGSSDVNGGYFHHAHVQVITQEGYEAGYQFKWYATEQDFENIQKHVLDPSDFFSGV